MYQNGEHWPMSIARNQQRISTLIGSDKLDVKLSHIEATQVTFNFKYAVKDDV